MESSTHHVISIMNGEEKKTFRFPLPPIISHLREIRMHWCLGPIISYLRDKHKDTRRLIHSFKVGISLLLVSLLYLLNPLFERVGENAMWAIMTVVVIFEFSAGATLGKGLNRGMGTILGGGLGCTAALLAQHIGGVGNSIIIGTSVFMFGTVATYFRLVPSIKKRYDYAVMIFILTSNLVVVSGARADEQVWEIATQRLLTILMGFIVCICVSLFVFPLWAGDEFHDSTVSRFLDLANSIQGCVEEYAKFSRDKDKNQSGSLTVCKSVLNSKSKDETLANFARWEPWHGKFGFSYPWEKYLKIGDVLRELAAFMLAVGNCLQASTQKAQLEQCEAIALRVAWTLRELGESIKQMRKCEAKSQLKAARTELSTVISKFKVAALENGDEVLATASFVLLLTQVVDKTEELFKEVEELGDIACFRTH